MIVAILSLTSSLIIAIGRQSAVFGRIKHSLWFFSNFEQKRIIFTIISASLGLLALNISPESEIVQWTLGISALFLISSYLFDFKYIFPEIKLVKKQLGSDLKIKIGSKIIGVKVNNRPVAYPLDVVVSRHIINDSINSNSIVVSYCAICRSGLVFQSRIKGENLYFKVSGVWRRNMIMIDDKTKSLWQQATGECIYGPLKGNHLKLLSGENTTWGSWSKKYPNSLYASKCIEARKGFLSRSFMLKGLEFATTRMTPPGFTNLKGLPNRETVFGIYHNGISKAYPENKLKEISNFIDYFDSIKVELNYDLKGNFLHAIEVNSKKELIVEKHWWLGWKEFHPDTEIWEIKYDAQQSAKRT